MMLILTMLFKAFLIFGFFVFVAYLEYLAGKLPDSGIKRLLLRKF